jgi:hypothetical protein
MQGKKDLMDLSGLAGRMSVYFQFLAFNASATISSLIMGGTGFA